jgi:hypothetical protein
MAPEQFRGEAADERTDIFNFCASVYESLYRAPAFAGDSAIERRTAVLANTRRVPPSTAHVPGYVRDALLKGLAHDRAERFSSMGALIEILSDAVSFEARRRRQLRLAGVALGMAALALVVALIWQRRAPAQISAWLRSPLSSRSSGSAARRPRCVGATRENFPRSGQNRRGHAC